MGDMNFTDHHPPERFRYVPVRYHYPDDDAGRADYLSRDMTPRGRGWLRALFDAVYGAAGRLAGKGVELATTPVVPRGSWLACLHCGGPLEKSFVTFARYFCDNCGVFTNSWRIVSGAGGKGGGPFGQHAPGDRKFDIEYDSNTNPNMEG